MIDPRIDYNEQIRRALKYDADRIKELVERKKQLSAIGADIPAKKITGEAIKIISERLIHFKSEVRSCACMINRLYQEGRSSYAVRCYKKQAKKFYKEVLKLSGILEKAEEINIEAMFIS